VGGPNDGCSDGGRRPSRVLLPRGIGRMMVGAPLSASPPVPGVRVRGLMVFCWSGLVHRGKLQSVGHE
jgi:hypothetical protein